MTGANLDLTFEASRLAPPQVVCIILEKEVKGAQRDANIHALPCHLASVSPHVIYPLCKENRLAYRWYDVQV